MHNHPLRIVKDATQFAGALRSEDEQLAGSGEIWKAPQECPLYFDWYRYCLPSLRQHGESCVGWAWTNWLESMIRKHGQVAAFADGTQINGHAVWARGRDMFWGGNYSAGLYLHQGFEALKDMGGVPPGTELMRVARDWDSVGWALLDSPLIQAHSIDNGWFDANHENGQVIRHGNRAGGHCTLRVSRVRQEGSHYYGFANSWGQEWGVFGFGIISDFDDRDTLFPSGLYTAKMPDGWKKWDGWKKLLIRP